MQCLRRRKYSVPYLWNQILGICPGDKIPSLENPLWCNCPSDAIKAADHKCVVCTGDGEVPNEEQSECVGKLGQGHCKDTSDKCFELWNDRSIKNWFWYHLKIMQSFYWLF